MSLLLPREMVLTHLKKKELTNSHVPMVHQLFSSRLIERFSSDNHSATSHFFHGRTEMNCLSIERYLQDEVFYCTCAQIHQI